MAYRYGDRRQQQLFPASIEDYVPTDSPVRVYDAFVDALDFESLGIDEDCCKVGNSSYDPRAMLKLLVYGYSYGVRSSRKLEREVYNNLSFIWLTGGLKPDHKTIAEFRRKYRSALKNVLNQSAGLCIKLGLIAGNTLFVDGSKMRANASLSHHWTESRCRKKLQQIDSRIEEILTECESTDGDESGTGSLVKLPEELGDQQGLRRKVEGILEQLQAEKKDFVNTTDSDCVRVHGRQGSHAGYNMQSVVDEEHGLIVHADVVSKNNDLGQLADQTEQAEETVGHPCKTVCADAGYSDYDDLERLDDQQRELIVPSKQQASKGAVKPFDKSMFEYDRENDVYVCPAGERLSYRRTTGGRKRLYLVGAGVCRRCRHFGICTTNRKEGRKITRYVNEDFRERLQHHYEQPTSQEIYRRRKEKVELPFGHIKRNLSAGHFLLRGLAGVKAEASLLASCFNLRRMITLIGVPTLVAMMAN